MVGTNLESALARAQEIISQVRTLQRGDRVFVIWHDACRVTNEPDVRAQYYSTRKETQGTIFDCVPDPDYFDVFYLIIWGEITSGRPDYYDAIPLAWIAKIQKLEAAPIRKLPRRTTKAHAPSKAVKRVMLYRKGRLVDDNGGVNKIALKEIGRATRAKKFVEEIVKVVR